jgi:hypothetical protein
MKTTTKKTAKAYKWELYDVCQVSYDGGNSWLDFATIKDASDASYAVQAVDGTHREFNNRNPHYRTAAWRIVRNQMCVGMVPIYVAK